MKFEIVPCPHCERRIRRGWSYQKNKNFSRHHCKCGGRGNLIQTTWDITWEQMKIVMLEAERIIKLKGPGYMTQLWDVMENSNLEDKISLYQAEEDWPEEYNWVSFGPRGMRFYFKFFAICRELLEGKIIPEKRKYEPGAWGKYLDQELVNSLKKDMGKKRKLMEKHPEYPGLQYFYEDTKARYKLAKSDLEKEVI